MLGAEGLDGNPETIEALDAPHRSTLRSGQASPSAPSRRSRSTPCERATSGRASRPAIEATGSTGTLSAPSPAPHRRCRSSQPGSPPTGSGRRPPDRSDTPRKVSQTPRGRPPARRRRVAGPRSSTPVPYARLSIPESQPTSTARDLQRKRDPNISRTDEAPP
jgi:hypothetical protein